MKKLMILGASILQLPAIKKAKQMGLQVVAVDMDPDAIGFKEDGIIKEVISTIDIPKVVEAAKRNMVDGVITLASDMPMRTVAAVAEELGLVGISCDTALKATNKVLMRKALLEHGVPIPRFFRASDRDEYEWVTSQFTSPFIVKPADNSGSRGVVKISDRNDKMAIYDAYDYSRANSRNGDIIVEEFMEGPEVSVETLTIDGECYVIQITDKLTTGAPNFVEMGHSQPTRLDGKTVDKIMSVAKAANEAIGITNSPSHTEIIVTSEGPKIVELGARLGGDCITTHLVPLSTGIDMVECCIKIAISEKPDIERKWNKGSAIRYFNQHAGVIRSIEGLQQARNIDGVCDLEIVHGIGDTITEINNSAARMGFVIAQADNADSAVDICERAKTTISVEVQ